jgi:hypothetical protein
MNIDADARGMAMPSLPASLSRSGLTAVVAQIKRRPGELYWRFRLVHGINPSQPAPERFRQLILESVERIVAADPGWFASVGLPSFVLTRWTAKEVEAVLKRFNCRPRELERWTRARFWFSTGYRSVDQRAFLSAARRELEAISSRERRKQHAEFLGEVLLRLDATEFARVVEERTPGLDLESPVVGSRLLQWLSRVNEAGLSEAYSHLSATFQALPIQLRSGRDRVVFDNLEGLVALRRRDLSAVGKCLEEMIALAPQAQFLGNDETMALARALAKERTLLAEVGRYVDAVLLSDWRSWVRPKLEEFRRELGLPTES